MPVVTSSPGLSVSKPIPRVAERDEGRGKNEQSDADAGRSDISSYRRIEYLEAERVVENAVIAVCCIRQHLDDPDRKAGERY